LGLSGAYAEAIFKSMSTQSPLAELAFAGQYARGLELFASLEQPSPEDERWAATCLYGTQRFLEAKDLLYKALKAGCRGAQVDLAGIFRQQGEMERAWSTLSAVTPGELAPLDQALYHRERASLLYSDGSLREAAQELDEARAAASAARLDARVIAAINHVAGLVAAERGRDGEALHYLRLAARSASDSRKVYVAAARGLSLTMLGRYEEAARRLEEARSCLPAAPVAEPVLTYYEAVLARARGTLGESLSLFRQAADLSRAVGEGATECYAELGAASVLCALGEVTQARTALARGRALAKDPVSAALARLREGQLLARQGDSSWREAVSEAEGAFQSLDRPRETAWVMANRVEGCLREKDAAGAEAALLGLTDQRGALGSGGPIIAELRLLPLALEAVLNAPDGAYHRAFQDDWRDLTGGAPVKVRLETLGAERLIADGRAVRLDLKRGLEYLVYLLANPDRTREEITTALAPDAEPRTAANYLHQVRFEIERKVPGLAIAFDKASRTYRVRCEGPLLSWDVADLKRLLSAGPVEDRERALSLYAGAFLPGADSEWARAEREALEWSVVKVGLETIEGWFREGNYGKCLELSERLLDIDPLNETLNQFLVRATEALEGAVAAQQARARIRARFLREVGEVPPSLDESPRDKRQMN
jgi:tetratricopeptide (TPR) repeat protein